jgi:hypothetical protein
VKQRTGETLQAERILLITHEELRDLYAKAGFEWVGKSAVAHGSRDWFEMRLLLPAKQQLSPPPIISQEAIAAALSAPPTRPAAARTVASFGGVSNMAVVVDDNKQANKYKIVCLRDGCGSLILLPRTAQLKEGPSLAVRLWPFAMGRLI